MTELVTADMAHFDFIIMFMLSVNAVVANAVGV